MSISLPNRGSINFNINKNDIFRNALSPVSPSTLKISKHWSNVFLSNFLILFLFEFWIF